MQFENSRHNEASAKPISLQCGAKNAKELCGPVVILKF